MIADCRCRSTEYKIDLFSRPVCVCGGLPGCDGFFRRRMLCLATIRNVAAAWPRFLKLACFTLRSRLLNRVVVLQEIPNMIFLP